MQWTVLPSPPASANLSLHSVWGSCGDNLFFWQGLNWFQQAFRADRFQTALRWQFPFTFLIRFFDISRLYGLHQTYCLFLTGILFLIGIPIAGFSRSRWRSGSSAGRLGKSSSAR
jgi:hypothetical protein